MTSKKRKFDFKKVKRFLPYVFTTIITLTVVSVGSISKHSSGLTLSLAAFAKSDYNISVDQLSELYTVANLSDILGLASTEDVASNYVLVASMYSAGQNSTDKIEKPPIINLNVSRGVVSYTVKEGDTMETIAATYKVTTDQIRWSNGLKTTAVTVGDVLYVPSTSGIVYTVKSGDTVDSIVSKYGGTSAEIIALNDLELSGLSEGDRILIKDGSLPETERPEYVPPAPKPTYTTSTYSYLGSSLSRQNLVSVGYYYGLGGPYAAGNCTQWAWHNRPDLPSNLGNASTWASRAKAAGFTVDNIPAAGAVFQYQVWPYGHVGYVEAVNDDGSIVVTEMNYNWRTYLVTRATIPANIASTYFYIH